MADMIMQQKKRSLILYINGEDPDQPTHPPGLIRAFSNLLLYPVIPASWQRRLCSECTHTQADLGVCFQHMWWEILSLTAPYMIRKRIKEDSLNWHLLKELKMLHGRSPSVLPFVIIIFSLCLGWKKRKFVIPYVWEQARLSKQCRPRCDAVSLHCLALIQWW